MREFEADNRELAFYLRYRHALGEDTKGDET